MISPKYYVLNYNDNNLILKPKDLVGDDTEIRDFNYQDLSKGYVKCINPKDGKVMGELSNKLENIKRADVPKYVKPSESRNSYELFIMVGLHAHKRQYLSINTIEKRLRYARFMQNYRVPIDFFNLNIDDAIDHFDARIDDNAGLSALRHEKKTIRMFLKSYDKWDKTWNENIDLFSNKIFCKKNGT